MLTYLQNILTKANILFLQFFSVVAIIHIVVIAATFFVGNKSPLSLTFSKNVNLNAQIKFTPLLKNAHDFSKKIGPSLNNQIKSSQVADQVKSVSAKSQKNSNFSVVGSRPVSLNPKKEQIKKSVPKKKQPIKKAPAKKNINKEETVKKVEPKKEELKQQPIKDIVKEEPIIEKVETSEISEVNLGVGEVLELGRDDKLVFEAYQVVQGQINEIWAPPLETDSDIFCDLKVSIDLNGKLNNIIIVKSSGVPMFDMSAKIALQDIVWPKHFHSKDIDLTFRP